jgi:hypothetical protein
LYKMLKKKAPKILPLGQALSNSYIIEPFLFLNVKISIMIKKKINM